jgi:hypothetical protein
MAKRKGIWTSFGDFIYTDLFPQKMGNDIVSSNAKVVLYGLFALVGFAILTYAFAVTGDKYQIDSDVAGNTEKTINDAQKVERFEQLEQINAVYIAAISGSLALGGTLIARLWGRG